MSQPQQFTTSNFLLNALSREDRALLEPHFTRVHLTRGDVLVKPDMPVEHVCFPEGGVVSIVSIMKQSVRIEAGIFGREGVSATCLLLGSDRSPDESVVQVNGSTALRIDTDRYLSAIRQSESLRAMLLRYVQTLLVQSGQNRTANTSHCLEARLARWLLMCHDRSEGDEIVVTHELLSMMVSAECSGITLIMDELAGAGTIRSERGRVVIRDREKLEELAGDSYGLPEAEYRRLIGPLGRRSSSLAFEGRVAG